MAQKVEVQLVDDVDGSEASQTVRFGLDGREYEIDLSDKNADELRASVAQFVNVARRTGGRSTTVRRSAQSAPKGKTLITPPDPAPAPLVPAQPFAPNGRVVQVPASREAVRAWARSHGYQVGDKGRIAREVMDAYNRAHPNG